MASPVKNIRFPEPLVAVIEAAAEANGRTFSAEVLAALGERYLGEGGEDARAAPRPRQERPPVNAPTPRPRGERDTAPRLREAETAGDAKGGGMVAGLALPVGNVRAPYQKGQGAQAKGKR